MEILNENMVLLNTLVIFLSLSHPQNKESLFFMPMHPDYSDLLNRTALNLCSLLVSLNEFPYFRFDVDQPMTGQIAAKTYMFLEKHVRNDADFWYRGVLDIQNRSTVLIVSRLSDLITPLLHSIAYEAMFQDYLHASRDGKVSVNPHNLLTFLAGGCPPPSTWTRPTSYGRPSATCGWSVRPPCFRDA